MKGAFILEDDPGTRLVLGARDRRDRIAFDRVSGLLIRHRLPTWLAPVTRIPTAALDRIRLVVSSELELVLAIRYRVGTSLAEITRAFTVRDLDVDHEAVDLAFRIATICRFGGYQIRHGEAGHAIELVPQAPDDQSPYRLPFPAVHGIEELAGADVQAIPQILAPARYDTDRPRFTEPVPPVEAPIASTLAGIRITRWEPSHVTIVTPPTITWFGALADVYRNAGYTFALLVLTAIVVAMFEGCRRVMWAGPEEAGFYSWKDYTAYAVGIVVLIVVFLAALGMVFGLGTFVRNAFRSLRRTRDRRRLRSLELDGDRLAITIDGIRRELPRTTIYCVRIRNLGAARYWSEIYLARGDDDVLVAITPLFDDESHEASIAKLAIGLARELDVPCHIDRPVSSSPGKQESR